MDSRETNKRQLAKGLFSHSTISYRWCVAEGANSSLQEMEDVFEVLLTVATAAMC
jgi:hypothetical protein